MISPQWNTIEHEWRKFYIIGKQPLFFYNNINFLNDCFVFEFIRDKIWTFRLNISRPI